ncbi:hypothetical protein SLS56_001959 [Neofusicoccum ribis]|uniref:Uncharacterized protein n=1 Tax=Neofusicoccum ribis TaxID=45134 RepID=A0ABR3T691_9PEZI
MPPKNGKKVTAYTPNNNTTDETASSRSRKSSSSHKSGNSLYEDPDAKTEALIQAAISDPRNLIKIYWNDRDLDEDEGFYEEGLDPEMCRSEKTVEERGGSEEFDRDEDNEDTPRYNDDGEDNEEGPSDENGDNNQSGEDNECDDDERLAWIEDVDDDEEVYVLPPRLSLTNSPDDDDETAQKHSPGKENIRGSTSQSPMDPSVQEKSHEGPPRPPRPQLDQLAWTEIPSHGQKSLVETPKDISKAFLAYRIKELRPGSSKSGPEVSSKRENMRRHYTNSNLNASISADEVDGVAENEHGNSLAQLKATISPISLDNEHSSSPPVTPPYPNSQKAFEDSRPMSVDTNQYSSSHFSGDDSEAGEGYVKDGVKRVQPHPRPQSAPPFSQPDVRSFWSDDSDSSEEDEKREKRARREREDFETIESLWSHSLSSEYLKVPEKDPAKERRAVRRLRDARAQIQEARMSDFPKLDIFDLARFNESIRSAKGSLRVQAAESGGYSDREIMVTEWIFDKWEEDQIGMRNAWKWERDEWESTKKAWKNERKSLKETRQRYIQIIKEQKEGIKRLEEDNGFYRTHLKHIEQMNWFPESKLSLVLGEPTATSPISPNSPIMPLQTPKEAWPDKAIAPPWFPRVAPEEKKTRMRQESGFMELTSPSHPDPFSDFARRCHCCGSDSGTCTCNCRSEAGLSSNADKKKIRELEKRNGKLMKRLVMVEEAGEYGRTLEGARETDEHKESQKLIKAAADLVDKVQVELIARQVEIMSVKGALGMSVDDATIRLSDVSTRLVRDPATDWEAEEQRAMVRRDLLEDYHEFTGLQLLDSDSDSGSGPWGPG